MLQGNTCYIITTQAKVSWPMKHEKLKKALRYGLSGLLVVGLIFLTGFLSFAGVLSINGSILLAITFFLLAGGIEGEVYAQNINQSLLKLFKGNYLEETLLTRKLDELTKQHAAKIKFFTDYKALCRHVNQLRAQHDDTEKRITAEKKLKTMKRFFRDYILGVLDKNNPYYADLFSALPSPNALQKEMKIKKWLSRASVVLSIIAGLSASLVAIEVAQTSLVAIAAYFSVTITATAMTTGIASLAILAGVGYTFLIYNTLTDIIHNDTIQKWAKKIRDFFHKKEGENTARFVLRAIGVTLGTLLVLTLGVLATITTAGVWWYAAKAGAMMLPTLASAAEWLRNIFVPVMATTSLTFSIVNGLQSVKEMTKISLKKTFAHLRDLFERYFSTENVFQQFNPFRAIIFIISAPFKLAVFIGHLVSMAFTNEGAPSPILPEGVGLGANILSEGATDFSYFFKSKNDHEHGQGHDHHHTDIPGKFLKMVLLPLYLLSALWDGAFSQFNKNAAHRLSPKQALKKSFLGIDTLQQPTVTPSSTLELGWEKNENHYHATSKIARAYASKKITDDEKTALSALADHHLYTSNTDEDKTPLSPWYKEGKVDAPSFFNQHALSDAGKKLGEKILAMTSLAPPAS